MKTLKFLNYYLSLREKFGKVNMFNNYHKFFVNKDLQ